MRIALGSWGAGQGIGNMKWRLAPIGKKIWREKEIVFSVDREQSVARIGNSAQHEQGLGFGANRK